MVLERRLVPGNRNVPSWPKRLSVVTGFQASDLRPQLLRCWSLGLQFLALLFFGFKLQVEMSVRSLDHVLRFFRGFVTWPRAERTALIDCAAAARCRTTRAALT